MENSDLEDSPGTDPASPGSDPASPGSGPASPGSGPASSGSDPASPRADSPSPGTDSIMSDESDAAKNMQHSSSSAFTSGGFPVSEMITDLMTRNEGILDEGGKEGTACNRELHQMLMGNLKVAYKGDEANKLTNAILHEKLASYSRSHAEVTKLLANFSLEASRMDPMMTSIYNYSNQCHDQISLAMAIVNNSLSDLATVKMSLEKIQKQQQETINTHRGELQGMVTAIMKELRFLQGSHVDNREIITNDGEAQDEAVVEDEGNDTVGAEDDDGDKDDETDEDVARNREVHSSRKEKKIAKGKKYKCRMCGKYYSSSTSRRTHLLKIHRKKGAHCSGYRGTNSITVCRNPFYSSRAFKKHYKLHHDDARPHFGLLDA